jgi:hypothetical protein
MSGNFKKGMVMLEEGQQPDAGVVCLMKEWVLDAGMVCLRKELYRSCMLDEGMGCGRKRWEEGGKKEMLMKRAARRK